MTRNELYFEFGTLIRSNLTFAGTKTVGEILDLFNKVGKIYIQRNLSEFTNNKESLNDFDKMLRIFKFPYFPLSNEQKGTRYDSKRVKNIFLNCLTEVINELHIKVTEKELNALELDKMYMQELKHSVQLDIDFEDF